MYESYVPQAGWYRPPENTNSQLTSAHAPRAAAPRPAATPLTLATPEPTVLAARHPVLNISGQPTTSREAVRRSPRVRILVVAD